MIAQQIGTDLRARRGAAAGLRPRRRCRTAAAAVWALAMFAGPAAAQPAGLSAPDIAAYGAFASQAMATPPGNIAYRSQTEQRLFELLNATRAERGLTPLSGSPQLQAVARVHAADMIARGYFAHVSPDGFDAATRVAMLDRSFVGLTGENIGAIQGTFRSGATALAERFHANWMRSSGHRENILRRDWTSVGIGVAAVGSAAMAVQLFGRETARVVQPVPVRVARGSRLDLRAGGNGSSAQFVDLWDPSRTAALGDPSRTATGPIVAPAGTYQLRFYFPRDGAFDIFDGPLIVVE